MGVHYIFWSLNQVFHISLSFIEIWRLWIHLPIAVFFSVLFNYFSCMLPFWKKLKCDIVSKINCITRLDFRRFLGSGRVPSREGFEGASAGSFPKQPLVTVPTVSLTSYWFCILYSINEIMMALLMFDEFVKRKYPGDSVRHYVF